MGLTKCYDCGEQVSSNALVCPKCGRAYPGFKSVHVGKMAHERGWDADKGYFGNVAREKLVKGKGSPNGSGCALVLLAILSGLLALL